MASKRKTRKQRRGMALRMPSSRPVTPVKMSWAPKPKVEAEATA